MVCRMGSNLKIRIPLDEFPDLIPVECQPRRPRLGTKLIGQVRQNPLAGIHARRDQCCNNRFVGLRDDGWIPQLPASLRPAFPSESIRLSPRKNRIQLINEVRLSSIDIFRRQIKHGREAISLQDRCHHMQIVTIPIIERQHHCPHRQFPPRGNCVNHLIQRDHAPVAMQELHLPLKPRKRHRILRIDPRPLRRARDRVIHQDHASTDATQGSVHRAKPTPVERTSQS